MKLKFKEPSSARGNEIQTGYLMLSLEIMKTKSAQTNNLEEKAFVKHIWKKRPF